VRTIRLEAVLGAVTSPAFLAVLSGTTGLGVAGWVVGLAAGWTATALLAAARIRSGDRAILPADWITLARALLAAGLAGLVADTSGRPVPVPALITLASVALLLDGVDGRVARRTGTATPLGARFDGEADAFLVLVLSVLVARDYGGWVLAIGTARYALLVAGWAVPWLAAPLPPRYWGKVVAAVVGIVLTVAATGWLPRPVGLLTVGVALALLAESFGRSVVWLYRTGAGPGARTLLRRATAVIAAAVVWTVLVAPDRLDQLGPAAFARIPVEGLALGAAGLLLPRRARRIAATAAGLALGLLTLVKVLDAGFYEVLARPFDPVRDWGNLGPAISVVRESIGTAGTVLALVLALCAVVLVVALVTASAVRVGTVTTRHRRRSAGGITVLGLVWALSAALSLQLVPGAPVASASSAGLVIDQVRRAQAAVADERSFQPAGHDPYPPRPGSPRAARSSTPPPAAPPAGWRTRPCSPGCGSTASSATTSSSPATGSRSATPSRRPAGARSASTPPTAGPGRPARPSTTTTGSTTGMTSATTGRRSASARCPTSTAWPRSSGWSSAPDTPP
jgi:phosphatidylglycerophosphate synthase